MAGNLTPGARIRIAALLRMAEKTQHVHGLVERYAAARDEKQAQVLAMPLKRAFSRLKLDLMGAGLDTLSQLAGAMEIAAGRGGSRHNKVRILREGVGSLRFQIDHEQRKTVSEDQEAQTAKERAAED